ncbi:ATP-grasp domain-containing protein [Labilibaculum sp. DW002]|uniref:ATP-grasp domain-containing protein n=1 Tax=Paralabilibaculum antarcticum TaxID=2912572 RepID=A0ABT5VMZ3_9BACT|nr:ATP-grasp domain-containing protein [Labilibaculum sp. DW002]MDE5416809.1 ATP-grasp domain-containing protein [Labilibaculum sp. DW002]
MKKPKYHIAVTGLNNTDNPGPGIPVIRGLRESKDFDVRVIGLAYENLEPGIYMPEMVDKTYQIPYPSSGIDTLLNRIEFIHSKERLDVIIPNFDAELFTFIQSKERLEKIGIKTFLPTIDQFEERQKANLNQYGEKYGVKVPFSKVITNRCDIEKLKDFFEFPLLVKGKFYDAYLAYSTEQVNSYFNRISAKWGMPVIIQEFIRGTEVNVIALGDGLGNTIGAVPMRKQYITDKGKAWGGITIQNDKMLALTRDLIRNTKWQGGMELELIKTVNNEYYLIEINPRIPAWVYLAVAAGQNLPEALVKLALGMSPPPFSSYEVGKMFIRYSYDLIGDISQFGSLSVKGEM